MSSYLSPSGVQSNPTEFGRFVRIIQYSRFALQCFGRGDLVLGFLSDISLNEVLTGSSIRPRNDAV